MTEPTSASETSNDASPPPADDVAAAIAEKLEPVTVNAPKMNRLLIGLIVGVLLILGAQTFSSFNGQARASCRAAAQAEFNKTYAQILGKAFTGVRDRTEYTVLLKTLQGQANEVDKC